MKQLITFVFVALSTALLAQNQDVTIDAKGIMRWPDGSEVQGFGVNYTVPFAHAYRSAEKLGVDHKDAIDKDVYHFARLGFDAYRVHVWDTEISDTLGNLIENKHLELFDYMLFKMKERGMKFLLTPIAFWGNGWPEPDEDTPGFSNKYGKADCLTNTHAIKAQENYLYQFLNHVSPYTKLAYKDDPDIVAFEVSNEPHHDRSPEEVTEYVSKMVQSMRRTGCQKPIFYNVSHSIHLVDAYYQGDTDGGTFQWYPTGLGAQEELGGNLLPNVDLYDIPFKSHEGFKKGGKIVYEFDAADVGRSYIYPAMARSFRSAGIQWATHFSYDPTYLAYANTEYNTHYMNMAYTPQKALSLKITSEVFHQVPVYSDFGQYPQNAQFQDFYVSYEEDLAVYNGETKFYYTNQNSIQPKNVKKLQEIAGFGNSELVEYEGTGAYFLDKLDDGVWRLEVMPDAIWVQNPFGRNSLSKTVAVINWQNWPMKIKLKDLGADFEIKGMNDGNDFNTKSNQGEFDISPGAYLVTKRGVNYNLTDNIRYKNISLTEFAAPSSTVKEAMVVHHAVDEMVQRNSLTLRATVVAPELPIEVKVVGPGRWNRAEYLMKRVNGYEYEVEIPSKDLDEGIFRYHIVVQSEGDVRTFPSNVAGTPRDWDFHDSEVYLTRILPDNSPVVLFDPIRDIDQLERPWHRGVKVVPSAIPGKSELQIRIDRLGTEDHENIKDYTMKYHFGRQLSERVAEITESKRLILRGGTQADTQVVLLALITKEGQAFGSKVTIGPDCKDYIIPIEALKPVKQVTLPRPYPGFLSYYWEGQFDASVVDMSKVETLQLSIIGDENTKEVQNIALNIEHVRLE